MFAKRQIVYVLLSLICSFLMAQNRDVVYSRISSAHGLSNDHVMYVGQLPDRRMLIVTHRTVNVYDGGRFATIPRDEHSVLQLPDYRGSYQVCLDRQQILWIKEWGRLWCVDIQLGRLVDDYDALFRRLGGDIRKEDLSNIFFDTDHHLWLLIGQRLLDVEEQRWYDLGQRAEEVADIVIYGRLLLLFLQNGGVCALSRDSGKEGSTRYPSLPQEEVWNISILPTGDERIYSVIAGRPSRVMEFNARSQTWRALAESDMVLYQPCVLDSNHIAIGTRHGILKLEVPALQKNTIRPCRLEGSNLPPSISTCCPARFVSAFSTPEETFNGIVVNTVCRDHQGGVWIGTDELGLLYTHADRYKFRHAKDYHALGISDHDAAQLHKRLVRLYDANKQQDQDQLHGPKGEIWHATHYGIIIEDGTTSTRLSTADGLPANHVISLTADRRGHVWAATNNGIAEIQAGAERGRYIVSTYASSDGVPGWNFLYSSSLLLPDGRIALQAQQGWVAFHPDSVRRPHTADPTPMLVGVNVNGRDTTAGDQLRVDYQHNNISLRYSTFDYTFPERVGYRWRMSGGAWKSGELFTDKGGILRLDLMQMVPGRYVIEVASTTDGSSYSARPARMEIVVSPPWWKSWWAYTLYILAVLALIAAAVLVYVRDQRRTLEWKRQEEVLQLRIKHLLEQAMQSFPVQAVPEEREAQTTPEPEEPTSTLNERDNEFIERVTSLIEQHLQDNYTVEQLASDLCMERTGLYKRLTALIDQSPQTFIRSIRLSRAAELLRQSDRSISDVAYGVGFTSPSYFVKCFREKYGCTPGEWREQNRQ